ncbi:hypothetical protein [Ellagibacter isourolithinifaciens]|uniref:hypothetical protein n=1 Tax=Ellagibacter isourolithinifaciens TaxID=2137581 RepID=UPI002E79176E|nr:hypothetical protein [Ellagibacter isourolithinifaciens]MEE0245757.1 hypothetical protein [Ellagibacter isourolithinifaciens]
MKVDLHCHTKATKGEGPKRNVTKELFVDKIAAADIEIVAITNHNSFDFQQYTDFSTAVQPVQVWPGAEFDVEGAFGNWHMLVIVDPREAESFEKSIEKLSNGRAPKSCKWTFEELWVEFSGWDALFVSHCHDKKPSIDAREIERIRKLTDNDWRLYFEPRSLATLGIWSAHGYPMLLGSDVKDWDSYEKCRFSNLRLRVDSFKQFLLLAKRDHQVVETLLNASHSQMFRMSPHESVCFPVTLYEDINVIFGQKGTGKTQLIRSIEDECIRLSIPVSSYYGGSKYNEYEKLVDSTTLERNASDFGRSDCVDDFKTLASWSDTSPTLLAKYVSWYQTRGNSKKKDRFQISEASKVSVPSETDCIKAKDMKTLAEETKTNWPVEAVLEYLEKDEAKLLVQLLGKLEVAAANEALKKYIHREAAKCTNIVLSDLKASIDRKSGTISKPGSTGFAEFAIGRMRLKSCIDRIADAISSNEVLEDSYLGRLEDKGELRLMSRKRFLCTSSRTEEFAIGISKLKAWKKAFDTVLSSVWADSLAANLANLCRIAEQNKITSVNDFIGTSRYVTLSDRKTTYEPSDGEKGILVIERKLREDAEIFLLDEPELGMSNQYVNDVIRERAQELASAGHTVVISTHNANLAVRTLPYLSIYREHVNGLTFKTYVGNPFVNELVNIDDNADRKDWSLVSMTTLEGGRDAFYDRETIYEAGIK